MALARVEIESTGPTTGVLRVDGRDLSNYVTGYQVSGRAGELPRVMLDVVGVERIDLTAADVTLPRYLTEGLIALGWTPPAQAEECPPAPQR